MEHTTIDSARNSLTAHEISLARVASDEWEAWVTTVSITVALCVVTVATYLLRLSHHPVQTLAQPEYN